MYIPESLSGFIVWAVWHLIIIKGWIDSYLSRKPKENMEDIEEISESCCSITGAEHIDTESRIRRNVFKYFYKKAKTRLSSWHLGTHGKLLQRSISIKRKV